jgi:aspartate 1-decarboxylase
MEGYRKLLGSKIHRATITHADLNYEGSISIPHDILKAAKLLPYEAVQIWDITSGNRLETYVIEGQGGSQDISINGAAAHLIKRGNLVIIARFVYLKDEDCQNFKPIVVFLDESNRIKEIREEIAGPAVSMPRSSKV